MSKLQKHINDLVERYGDAIRFTKSACSEHALSSVPEALRELYRNFDTIGLPFGDVYSMETAIEQSQAEPFQSEGWFCFGFDKYFSFWLCKKIQDEEGLSFTTWDHDGGCEIGRAIYGDIIEFLVDMQHYYAENRNRGKVLLVLMPGDKLKFMAELRKTFALTTTSRELLEVTKNLPCVIGDTIMEADAQRMINETGHPECFRFVSEPFR